MIPGTLTFASQELFYKKKAEAQCMQRKLESIKSQQLLPATYGASHNEGSVWWQI